jgi:hypothetical protein
VSAEWRSWCSVRPPDAALNNEPGRAPIAGQGSQLAKVIADVAAEADAQ